MFVPSNNWRNSNEGFRKDVSYNHIKSQKKQGFYPLSRKYRIGRTMRGGRGWVKLPFKV